MKSRPPNSPGSGAGGQGLPRTGGTLASLCPEGTLSWLRHPTPPGLEKPRYCTASKHSGAWGPGGARRHSPERGG